MTRRTFLCWTTSGMLASAVTLPVVAQAQVPQTVQIGLMQGLFKDTQPALVQALSKPLRDLIQRSTGLTGDVELVSEPMELAEKLKTGKVQLAVFHGYEYAWVKQQDPEIRPLVVSVPPAKKFQASIVVHAESEYQCLADLKEEAVIIPRATKGHCMLFFEKLHENLPASVAKAQTKPAMTSEEALDAVLMGDQAAVLVDASAFLGYQNLQPGAAKQLRMLAESEVFPPTVVAYRQGGLPESNLSSIQKLLTEAHQNAAGKPLLMLWNLKGFETPPANYNEQLAEIAKKYPCPAPKAESIRTVGRAKN